MMMKVEVIPEARVEEQTALPDRAAAEEEERNRPEVLLVAEVLQALNTLVATVLTLAWAEAEEAAGITVEGVGEHRAVAAADQLMLHQLKPDQAEMRVIIPTVTMRGTQDWEAVPVLV